MDAVAIIDFGSQYAHLIANRVRRLGVYSEVLLPDAPLAKIAQFKGIILSGGPQSVYGKHAPTIDKRIFSLGVPILGLCYGHQLICHLLGGKVQAGRTKEYGLAQLQIFKKQGIFKGISSRAQVWMSHGDAVTKLPPGFSTFGKTGDCEFAAFGSMKRKIFGAQFHMEVTHTRAGMKMLDNFLDLCKVKRQWSTRMFLRKKMEEIKRTLGSRKIFLLVSGGVDSTVAYALLAKTLGSSRVYGLFIDTGLMRKNEGSFIQKSFKKTGIKNFHAVHAGKVFLKKLARVTDPEQKRRVIGDTFLKIQAQEVRKLKLNPDEWVLGQGTIYPDTIESAGTAHADKIKTHHNRVPEILELIKCGRVIEPLAELYKDEVRKLGEKLGLPHDMVWRHPFPGPGLGVRILCAKKEVWPKRHKEAEKAIAQFLAPHGFFGKILPIQSVGVQGDSRTYRNPLVIMSSPYFMSSPRKRGSISVNTSIPSFAELEYISTSLTNRFPQINRVCLLLTPQKIDSIKLHTGAISKKRVEVLQNLDDIVMNFVKKQNLDRKIWQFPTVLLPLAMNGSRRESVVLRPVESQEAMTANFYKMESTLLKQLTAKLSSHISAVLYDITNKPPGTIEWE